MPIGLIRLISAKKVLKPVLIRVQNRTLWVVITPPNRYIASPIEMKEEESNQKQDFLYISKKNEVIMPNLQQVIKILPNDCLKKSKCYAKSSIKTVSTPR